LQKILFIIPSNFSYEMFTNVSPLDHSIKKEGKQYNYPVTDIPLGVLSLSAYLKKYIDIEIKILDFNVILNKIQDFNYSSFSDLHFDYLLKEKLEGFIPDIIGISTLFITGYSNMIDIANKSRQLFNAIIIGGGGIPVNMHERIFSETNSFDAFCYGEGEKPLLDLLQSENKTKLLVNHSSWITKEKSINKNKFKYDFIKNLNEIPSYDYNLLDLDFYKIKPMLQTYFNHTSKSVLFPYVTSRGCPYKCSFCASHTVHGRKMRYQSVIRVKEDLLKLKKEFNAEVINFMDDNLSLDADRMIEILSYAIEIGLHLHFQAGLAVQSLTRKTLEKMKSIGITDIVVPIESGSKKVLKNIMHKPIDLKMSKQVIDDCRELGIETNVCVLIGLPGETKQDIEDTRQFLNSLNANWFRITVATPLVGSKMYNTCIENNYLTEDITKGNFKNSIITTEEFIPEYIEETIYEINLEINFVENADMKFGRYEKALNRFNGVLKVKDDHAFAYYFSAECYWKLEQYDKYNEYMNKYSNIIEQSEFWKKYAIKFGLPV